MKRLILNILLIVTVISFLCPISVFAEEISGENSVTVTEIEESNLDARSVNSVITVVTSEEISAVVNDLNNNGGEKTIILGNDITLQSDINAKQELKIENGTLTILGNGHTLTVCTITMRGNAVLNLGKEDGSDKLMVTTNANQKTYSLIQLYPKVNSESEDSPVLNMYNGVTLKDSESLGQSGAIILSGKSVFNMYGGVITNCISHSTGGAVSLVQDSIFNMYGGLISDCLSYNAGGAVGFSSQAIGSDTAGKSTFNMFGGEIKNCTTNETYGLGGGGIGAYTVHPVAINIFGGKITDCKSLNPTYGFGGAIFIYSMGDENSIKINGGEISGNSAIVGGGIFLYAGNIIIADGVAIYNNNAVEYGADIFNNGGDNTNITVGNVGENLVLSDSNQIIDGWYYDESEYRYDHNKEETILPYDNIGKPVSYNFSLKAAHKTIVPVEDIALEDRTVELKEKTLTLNPTITPGDATNKHVTWSSSNEEIATVAENGVVTLNQRGGVIITATTEDGIHTASAVITIICSHEFGEGVVVKEATATEDGLKERVCSICGDKETEVISALGLADYDSPQTGDNSNIALWIILIFASAIVLKKFGISNIKKFIK